MLINAGPGIRFPAGAAAARSRKAIPAF